MVHNTLHGCLGKYGDIGGGVGGGLNVGVASEAVDAGAGPLWGLSNMSEIWLYVL